jgi:hypothetical protein
VYEGILVELRDALGDDPHTCCQTLAWLRSGASASSPDRAGQIYSRGSTRVPSFPWRDWAVSTGNGARHTWLCLLATFISSTVSGCGGTPNRFLPYVLQFLRHATTS